MDKSVVPRILLIAEMANPEWVSVPLLGWSGSRAIAALADTHVVTQIRNREAFLRAGLKEGIDFTAINTEAVAANIYRFANLLRGGSGKGWTTVTALSSLSYYYFEHLLWQRFADDIRKANFSLIHRLTPVSPTTPSVLAKRALGAGIPFVIGPLNGGLPWPSGFDQARRKEKEWLSYARSAYKLLPGYRSTRRDASAIIVGSRETFKQTPERYHHKCIYIPENSILPERFKLVVDRPADLPVRVAFVGRLVPYKGGDMLLEAAAPLIRSGKITVDVIGDGPEMPNLRQIVKQHQLESGVRLDGWVEHSQLQHRLVESDVLGFPSIREFGGGVVLEAMALGLMPIVVDYGGPGELVTESTGYRIPIGTRRGIIEQLRETLARIVQNPSSIRSTGCRARQRVLTHFTWQAKARQINEVYRWVLGQRNDKPDFGMPLVDTVYE